MSAATGKGTTGWHGVPRSEVPWFPNINQDACSGCGFCYVTCGKGVYSMTGQHPTVDHPSACQVGCTTCATLCPRQAIDFPDRSSLTKIIHDHKVLKTVRQEALLKRQKESAAQPSS
ncbi:MAG TPA: hypothetical protein VHN99_04605 [Deinococcales bacterium]|nr:hypothetical protein [Deinococcales bacterium]